ncbi:hypothetical protein LY90DRAFT_225877 [Neocallimastix californiae]|uniref:Uncharacterized protein n=1 Tax=Neocallimastix californiae TaxID=1754190 RepID=A0A1Y2E222_9FUNG|nr:hypothetical protein LY90DRAFT_225877 [Neocallimastix californiae]|eukprot:ORY65601.1 hypothetical protein LY90DRAFT_225877 [Neocallimastix californiae]
MKIQLKFHLNILLILCKSCLCQFYDSLSIDYNKLSKYTLDTYDENDVVTRYHLNYNFHYYQFDEYNDMLFFTDIKYAIICHDEDIDKPDDEKETLLFWNTSIYKIFMSTTIYINAFPIWYIEQKQKGKIFCMRFDSVGWDKNGSEEICKNESLACPDLIILKTSQLTHRYFNGDTLNLNKYFRKYYKKNGKSFDSLLNKYSYYEYRINNNWLAVPLSEDFRIFQINITTFNDCISEGYDLHYPPPLSNYWGPNYKETWTWEKAFEYAGKIYNCTKKPGFKILNNYNEDVSFFSALCQSLNIPFITEDIDTNIKKCGLRKPEAIQKLSILKDLAENHYIEMWINKTTVKEWQNKKYPTNVEEQPLITYDNDYIFNDTSVNGMTFNTLFEMKLQSDLRYVYVPGSTSSLLGTGIIITKNSRFPDESFEFIEVLINENYTFYTELNVSKTPIENISGKRCIKNYETFKKTHCSSLIQSDGEYPYYYIRNNITTFIYLTHKNIGEERGISINVDTLTSSSIFDKETFRNKEFICDQQANFEESTITYQDDYKLVIPLSNNETILLKSTVDINNNSDQTIEMICSIYDETLKKSKPVQFPYYNFYEMDNVISKSPISLLFAHLYYKHNTTNEGSFERIVNECCDIIDNALIPYCQDIKDIKFSFNKCFNNNLTMPIVYSNCKIKENDNIPRYAEYTFYFP